MTRLETLASFISVDYEAVKKFNDETFYFAPGHQHSPVIIRIRAITDLATAAKSTSEQEVRQMIEKYRTAILQRDIAALEKIWADDYVFVNAAGDVLAKTERLANISRARLRWTQSTRKKMLSSRLPK